MPLDVQPLSPLRNAIRVGAMLALLGGSLAFASYLTRKHADRVVTFDAPAGAAAPMAVNHDWPNGQESFSEITIPVDGGTIQCAVFDILNPPAVGAPAELYAQSVLLGITQDNSQIRPYPSVKLGGLAAVQFDQAYRDHLPETSPAATATAASVPSARYAILRLAIIDHRLVAICFSGDAGITDAIKQSFNAYCLRGVHVAAASSF